MKKTLFKLGFILLCVGLIVFLLLPFLETTAPTTSALNAGTSQIATENPLNAVAKKLAALFGRKEKNKVLSPTSTTPNDTAAAPLLAQDLSSKNVQTQMAAIASHTNQGVTRTIDLPATNYQDGYEGASFQTDDGEWVLIQQTAPEHSAPGMHEVNVHENPYDRYIRQERARHFAPRSSQSEIPDSKWARLIQPIKNFFGFAGPTPVSTSLATKHLENDKLAALSSNNHKQTTNNTTPFAGSSDYSNLRSPFPGISIQQWLSLSPEERERFQENLAAQNFANLLSGAYAAREAAEISADLQFPNPKNEAEKQKKEELIQKLTQQNMEQIREKALENIYNNTEGLEYTDELSTMIGCSNASIPISSCSTTGEQPQPLPEEQLTQAKEANAARFYEKTLFRLPEGIPVTVVLGPTTRETFQAALALPDIPGAVNAPQKGAAEIFLSMFDQQKCDSNRCFWLPNSKQPDPQLNDTFKTVGNAHLKPDPYKTYDTYKEKFVQDKVQKQKEANPDATREMVTQWQKQAEDQWNNNRPNWVPYTEEQITQLHQDNIAALSATPEHPSDKQPIFPVVMDPGIARDMAKLTSPVGFVYNKDSWTRTPGGPEEQGSKLTDSLIDNVNETKEIVQEVYQRPINDSVQAWINQASQGGFDALLNGIKQGGPRKNSAQK